MANDFYRYPYQKPAATPYREGEELITEAVADNEGSAGGRWPLATGSMPDVGKGLGQPPAEMDDNFRTVARHRTSKQQAAESSQTRNMKPRSSSSVSAPIRERGEDRV
ncbi:hypothetical protein PG997_003461 [Apiospora hydei]|uniref:Uncharacterized protein n=1 Tax=Apiospora hydei TaxID=1337664 RepID=A0ABR1WZE1_9PEZI